MSNIVELQFNDLMLKNKTGGAFGESYMINPSTAPPAPVQSTPVGSYMINPSTAPVQVTPVGSYMINPSTETPLATPLAGISAINPSVNHIHRHSHANGAEPHSHGFH